MPARKAGPSGDETQFGVRLTDWLADDPPKLDSPRIEHLAFLCYPDAGGEVVDLPGDCWQRLAGTPTDQVRRT